MSGRHTLIWIAWIAVLFLATSVCPRKMNRKSRNTHMTTSDYLMRIKCRAKCLSDTHSHICDYDVCLKEMRGGGKLGSCPSKSAVIHHNHHLDNETRSNYLMDSNCIDACASWDYNCPEAERCCPHSCGSSCSRPTDLDRVHALPPVPCKLSVMESRRKIEICWNIFEEIRNKTLFFVIEGRSHLGEVFASHKLSDWTIFHAHPRYDHVFRLSESSREIARRWCFIMKKIKPGRWYQFRVASVNEYGTRGFSRHSAEIQLKDVRGQKYPRAPTVSIGPVESDRHNASLLSTTLSWTLQRTQSIPVDKYKIFWSRHLPGVINSVSMQQATVFEPQRHFELRQLAPDSTYYVQVQSISVFGQRRLRSKKTSFTLNTTGIETGSTTTPLPSLSHLHVRHLSSKVNVGPTIRHRFMLSKANELVVKVRWQHPANYSHFQLELCKGTTYCLDKVSFGEYRVVNTTRNSFEFLDLGFDTGYALRLKSYQRSTAEPRVTQRTFITPACSAFKNNYNLKSLSCRRN